MTWHDILIGKCNAGSLGCKEHDHCIVYHTPHVPIIVIVIVIVVLSHWQRNKMRHTIAGNEPGERGITFVSPCHAPLLHFAPIDSTVLYSLLYIPLRAKEGMKDDDNEWIEWSQSINREGLIWNYKWICYFTTCWMSASSHQHYSFILLALARTDENGLAFLNRAIKDLRRSRDGKLSCVTNRLVLKVRWPFTIIPCCWLGPNGNSVEGTLYQSIRRSGPTMEQIGRWRASLCSSKQRSDIIH